MSLLRVLGDGARIHGTVSGLASATQYAGVLALDADTLQRVYSGEKKLVLVCLNAAATSVLWAIRIADGGADSATTLSPQPRTLNVQIRIESSGGEKSAQVTAFDPLAHDELLAGELAALHWWVDSTDLHIKLVGYDGTILGEHTASLGGATPATDSAPLLVANATVGDDPSFGTSAQATAELGEAIFDGLALYSAAQKFTVGADAIASKSPGDTNLAHLYYFEDASGSTVTDAQGSADLTIDGTEGIDYAWGPYGPSLNFDDNVGPPSGDLADFEYATLSGGSVSGIVQNQRYEGHRNGANANGNLRLQATAGVYRLDGSRWWKTRMLLRGPTGFFDAAREFVGPSLALRENADIANTYVNIGISYDSGSIVVSSIIRNGSGDTPTANTVVVGDPNDPGNEFDLKVMLRTRPDGSGGWLASTYMRRVPVGASTVRDRYWVQVHEHATAFATADLNACMVRLTTQNNATVYAFGSGEFHGFDDVNPLGDWRTVLNTYDETLTEGGLGGETFAALRVLFPGIDEGGLGGEEWDVEREVPFPDLGAVGGETFTAQLLRLLSFSEGGVGGDEWVATVQTLSDIVEGAVGGETFLAEFAFRLRALAEGALGGEEFVAQLITAGTFTEGAVGGDSWAVQLVTNLTALQTNVAAANVGTLTQIANVE